MMGCQRPGCRRSPELCLAAVARLGKAGVAAVQAELGDHEPEPGIGKRHAQPGQSVRLLASRSRILALSPAFNRCRGVCCAIERTSP